MSVHQYACDKLQAEPGGLIRCHHQRPVASVIITVRHSDTQTDRHNGDRAPSLSMAGTYRERPGSHSVARFEGEGAAEAKKTGDKSSTTRASRREMLLLDSDDLWGWTPAILQSPYGVEESFLKIRILGNTKNVVSMTLVGHKALLGLLQTFRQLIGV